MIRPVPSLPRSAAPALLAACLSTSACVSTSAWERELPEGEAQRRIEAAHAAEAWRAQDVLELELSYAFADVEYDARVWIEVDGGRSRLESGDVVLVDDGRDVWMSPPDADFPNPAFHARLHAGLVSVPYTLGSARAVTLRGKRVWEERRLAVIEASYPEGRGGVLGDVQYLYVDPETDRVNAVGFRTALVEDNPYGHAVVYRDPVTVEGVPIFTYLPAFRWSEERSIVPGHIAAIAVQAQRFAADAPGRFDPPQDAVRVPESGPAQR